MVFGLSKGLELLIAVVAIVIIASAAYALSGSVPTISSNTTVSLSANSSYNFHLPDSQNVSSIFLYQSSNSTATIYFGKVPVLSNPISVISFSATGQVVNISTVQANSADLQITLVSSSPKSSTFSLSYVPKSLDIRQSTGVKMLNSNGTAQSSTTTTVSTVSTPLSSSHASTSSSTTTTTVHVNAMQQAIVAANDTSEGMLMTQFNSLYVSEAKSCTQNLYNSDFAKAYSMLPTGPSTFANASIYVPRSISASAKLVTSPNIYNVTYTAIASAGNTKILTLQVNVTGDFVITSAYGGFFTSYTDALEQYQAINISSDPCSAYV